MKMKATKFAIAACAAVGLTYCTTSKNQVKREWEQVEKERADAEKATKQLAEKDKKQFEKDAQQRLDKFESRLVTLRADQVQATGTKRKDLQDRIWQLEREITDARAQLKSMRNESAVGWDNDRQRLEERLDHIDDVFGESEALTH